jgi:hypothetical protein
MKKVLLLAVMAIFFAEVKAQEPLSFSKVIPADSINKNDIYSGLKQWFALNSNSKQTLEVDDRETGLLIANFSAEYSKSGFFYISYEGYINYSITIQVKDGRYKVTIDKFTHDTKNPKSVSKLGLITTGSYTRGGINASFDKKIWLDIQKKSEAISTDLFSIFEKMKFSNKNDNNW